MLAIPAVQKLHAEVRVLPKSSVGPVPNLQRSEVGQMLAAPTKARLMRELGQLSKDPPPGIAAYCPDSDDITQIRAQISGPGMLVQSSARYMFAVRPCLTDYVAEYLVATSRRVAI